MPASLSEEVDSSVPLLPVHLEDSISADADSADGDSVDADSADGDSAYAESLGSGNSTRTLSFSDTNYRFEHGRRYHAYRDGSYWVCILLYL
jgi:hypothetical protein